MSRRLIGICTHIWGGSLKIAMDISEELSAARIVIQGTGGDGKGTEDQYYDLYYIYTTLQGIN